MRRSIYILLSCFCLLSLFFTLAESASAQKRKKPVKKKPKITRGEGIIAVSIGNVATIKSEPFLTLEPCAKETPEQISELETAADKNAQVEILVKRAGDKDEWIRACSVYRLGTFGSAAQSALPVIIKLLRDEKKGDVWYHVETAMWKIPPDKNIPLKERLRNAAVGDVYERLYAIYSLAYFKYSATSFQAKDILNTLIETAKDEDITVRWLSVMGIRQQGFYGTDISDSIPLLTDLLKNKKLNPVYIVRVFVPMGEKALPAAPLLMDILYNPKNYFKEKDADRSYVLYLTTAIALGKIGKPLIPLLEKEIEKQPFDILQVLSNIEADEKLPLIYKAMKHTNPEVRKKAVESLPGFTSMGAIIALPELFPLLKDVNVEVRKAAMSKIGSIAQNTENQSPELKEMLRKKAVPALIARLPNKDDSCYAAMNLGDFGAAAEAAIPALVKMVKNPRANYCAMHGLYDIGEKGRKFLTAEQIEQVEKSKSYTFDSDYNKAKPIKPKEEPKPTPVLSGKDT